MAGFRKTPPERGADRSGNKTMAGFRKTSPERGADSGEIIAQRGLECNTAAPWGKITHSGGKLRVLGENYALSGKSRAPSRNFMRRAALPLYFAGKKWYS